MKQKINVNNSSKTVAVIILTFNEEINLPHALDSVAGWANEIFVLDSFSTDRTLEIASKYDCIITQNKFIDYSTQRNYAIENLSINSEWVLFLDADEWLPDAFKSEVTSVINKSPVEDGFLLSWRFMWMGRWVKRGYYPTWIMRLFRHGKVRFSELGADHPICEGKIGKLRNDFMHEDRKSVTEWIAKHNDRAIWEAKEQIYLRSAQFSKTIDANLFGTQAQRKRWLRYRVWNYLPPLIRPFIYFFYRYVLLGGFLDGRSAFTYHFLQALWFPMLIDIKYLEMIAFGENGSGDGVE
jgi:glycosyltransferase involved in cell wall biosynthesis